MKVLELFSGIGAQHKALTNIGIDCECTQCDIDKYAIQSYNAIHGETVNLGDISLIKEEDLVKDQWDLITYSSPCQDFSFAGLQAGGEKGSGTRSSLLWEVEKVIRAVRPKYLVMENVKALVSKKFKPCFDKWIETLDSYGYKTKWQVLNARDYGIPQNRERVFAVSIRNDIEKEFEFPDKKTLDLRLKDVLETNVDKRYYLSDEIQEKFKNKLKNIIEPVICASRGRNPDNPSDRTTGCPTEQTIEVNSQGISNTLTCVQKDNWVIEPNVLTPKRTEYGKMIRKAYESGELKESRHNMTQLEPRTDGISNTLTCVQKDNWVVEPQIQVLGNYKPSGHECGRIMNIEGISPTIKENHGAVCAIAEPQENRLFNIYGENKGTGYAGNVWDKDALAPTLKTMQGGNSQPMIISDEEIEYKIRKLTPTECWRLMGFDDEDINKARASGISNCQLYKQAGNSIVVNVLEEIFKNLLF